VSTPSRTSVVTDTPASATETILLVEDEQQTRDAVQRTLMRAGYTVIAAGNGVEAMHISRSHPYAIHLVLTDSLMPEMGGSELVKRLKLDRPGIGVIMMSGYTEDLAPTGPDGDLELFIEKPFTSADLLVAIRQAINTSG
jgi:DNA-binding NtrC family response regulator